MADYGVSQMMQALGRRYVFYINRTYKRIGTLWEGQYKSSLINSEHYLFTCMRRKTRGQVFPCHKNDHIEHLLFLTI